ncbi:hypothetical protein ES702_06530 [subsurface metagenome]
MKEITKYFERNGKTYQLTLRIFSFPCYYEKPKRIRWRIFSTIQSF